ncbi:hypothetical protein R3I93_012231 [Phoxinus phoxinus]|uniref:Uncharacterized protein n=1 Tax=Phoxinus phoxinus TaxID=58324 RepID=A0AAN9D0R8_9TELE
MCLVQSFRLVSNCSASSGAWCCALESGSFSDLSRFCWALLRWHVPDLLPVCQTAQHCCHPRTGSSPANASTHNPYPE